MSHHIKINLPETGKPRVVVVGGGFAGLTLVQKLNPAKFQIVLLDRNNYHQFQPLFYQVAMAGLEPSSIVFPFRKLFQGGQQYFRLTEVEKICPQQNQLITSHGIVNYDYLVLAMGSQTHFFSQEDIQQHALPLKSVSEALYLRNRILEDYEKALTCADPFSRQKYLNIILVGGGPTGVELAGALAEMKRFILPKDYPELDHNEVNIYLIESNNRLLKSMSASASQTAEEYLRQRGVKVLLGERVTSYDGQLLTTQHGTKLLSDKVIWAAGVSGAQIGGLSDDVLTPSNRYTVTPQLQVKGYPNIFAIGDISLLTQERFPKGHPQVAQVAIQQARFLANYLNQPETTKKGKIFVYKDLGSLATIGRHAAVADLGGLFLKGITAWYLWLGVHLKSLLGVKNKIFVLLNWIWNYLTYDQPLRVMIRPRSRPAEKHTPLEPIGKKP
jgi:NADH dehydrogenase